MSSAALSSTDSPLNAFVSAAGSALAGSAASSTSLPSTSVRTQGLSTASSLLTTAITPSSFQSTEILGQDFQTPSSIPSESKTTFGTSSTSAPSTSLSRSTQIGLGVGISLGGLFLIALGAFLAFCAVRIRARNKSDNPHGTNGNSDTGLIGEVAPHRQTSPQELSGVQREMSRKELDGTHWKRELPALPEYGLRRSETNGL